MKYIKSEKNYFYKEYSNGIKKRISENEYKQNGGFILNGMNYAIHLSDNYEISNMSLIQDKIKEINNILNKQCPNLKIKFYHQRALKTKIKI